MFLGVSWCFLVFLGVSSDPVPASWKAGSTFGAPDTTWRIHGCGRARAELGRRESNGVWRRSAQVVEVFDMKRIKRTCTHATNLSVKCCCKHADVGLKVSAPFLLIRKYSKESLAQRETCCSYKLKLAITLPKWLPTEQAKWLPTPKVHTAPSRRSVFPRADTKVSALEPKFIKALGTESEHADVRERGRDI